MEILTWNIQAALGVDGAVDPERIAGVISAPGVPDVICLQEVARHFPQLDGGRGEDQVSRFETLFPGHAAFFGAAVDRDGGAMPRRRFGNLILSRLTVEQCFTHPLPQPAAGGVRHMPRQATEVVVRDGQDTLRVITTHLEFHARSHRSAQVSRILELQREARGHGESPPRSDADGPYAAIPRPTTSIVCGDFNFEPGDPDYAAMIVGSDHDPTRYADAWAHLHGVGTHRPTCGVHDREQWPVGPHCRDFFFTTTDLLGRLRSLEVDEVTAASDHQPVRLRLAAAQT